MSTDDLEPLLLSLGGRRMSTDNDRSTRYETDPLVRLIEDTIRAERAERRLYPDLYAETLADVIREQHDPAVASNALMVAASQVANWRSSYLSPHIVSRNLVRKRLRGLAAKMAADTTEET